MPRITPILKVVYTANIHKPSESGASLARLAIAHETAGITGKCFEEPEEIRSSKDRYNEEKQDDLWQWTVNYCAQDKAQAPRFEAFM